MKTKILIIGLIFIIFTNLAVASNPYGEIYTYEVYYNGIILPGTDVAKPTLKIGEPFEIKVNMTVYQEYKVSGALYEIGSGNFEVIEGPSEMNRYSGKILMPNESHVFKWVVKPTDGWAGGSLPIDFRYSLVEKGNPEPVLNSGFTVAYPYISTEYYEGKVPSSDTSPSETLSSPNSTSSESIPAFTILAAVFAITLISFRH
ncbi:MAG: sarcinarray family MAST domain-containing protein [Methanosarcinaceae archaeon]|nr:sarcinarray family MAST domain-containing protein [Methanosarcinaceae archaeon]